MYPRIKPLMFAGGAPPPPPPPPPPPALSVSVTALSETILPNGGSGGRVFTSSTTSCAIVADGGVPVTNPSYSWIAYYDLGAGTVFCGISGQGTPSVQITTGPIPDNSVISISYGCNLDDLDRPGRTAGNSKTWVVRTEFTP